jgi:hypothetical protein
MEGTERVEAVTDAPCNCDESLSQRESLTEAAERIRELEENLADAENRAAIREQHSEQYWRAFSAETKAHGATRDRMIAIIDRCNDLEKAHQQAIKANGEFLGKHRRTRAKIRKRMASMREAMRITEEEHRELLGKRAAEKAMNHHYSTDLQRIIDWKHPPRNSSLGTRAGKVVQELRDQLTEAHRINDAHREENGRLREECERLRGVAQREWERRQKRIAEVRELHQALERRCQQRDENRQALQQAREECERMRDVVEAALAWRKYDESEPIPSSKPRQMLKLVAFAVDDYRENTRTTTDPPATDAADTLTRPEPASPEKGMRAGSAPDHEPPATNAREEMRCATCQSHESCGPNPPFAVGCLEYVERREMSDQPDCRECANPCDATTSPGCAEVCEDFVPRHHKPAPADPLLAATQRAEKAEAELARVREACEALFLTLSKEVFGSPSTDIRNGRRWAVIEHARQLCAALAGERKDGGQ